MHRKHAISRRNGLAVLTAVLASLAFAGCTTTPPQSDQAAAVERAGDLESNAQATLTRLYEAAPDSKALVDRAKGVLVFPRVLGASFVVGAEHGDGVLLVDGRNEGYYSTTAGSFGFQAGAQSKAIVLLFMTDEALENFRNSSGWTAGVDATVSVATIGANGSIDTNTAKQSVVGFVLTNAGLMAGVSLQGAKINKKAL